MLFYVQMNENKQDPNNLIQLPTNYDPLILDDSDKVAKYEERTKTWSPKRKNNFWKHFVPLVLVASGFILLAKYGFANDSIDQESLKAITPIEQIVEEPGAESLMIYDGVIVVKPNSQLRTSPEVNNSVPVNDAGKSSNDPNNPTEVENPEVSEDLKNPANGLWFKVGEDTWTNWQNVVEFDRNNIKSVDVDAQLND